MTVNIIAFTTVISIITFIFVVNCLLFITIASFYFQFLCVNRNTSSHNRYIFGPGSPDSEHPRLLWVAFLFNWAFPPTDYCSSGMPVLEVFVNIFGPIYQIREAQSDTHYWPSSVRSSLFVWDLSTKLRFCRSTLLSLASQFILLLHSWFFRNV